MAVEDRGEAREPLQAARERYPAPLAWVASELDYELSATHPNFMRCFLLEIDLFEISVAFFAFIQVAQLIKSGRALKSAEAAVMQLRDNPQMCTGHWWGLLREASRDVHALPAEAPAAIARELAGLYFDPAGRAARVGKMLDQVPGLRNRIKGHSWTLPGEQYESHARELLATVSSYLACLECLAGYALFQCKACDPAGEGSSADIVILQGDSRRPMRQRLRALGPLAPGLLYIARKDDLLAGAIDTDVLLCLNPFIQMRSNDSRTDELYLLQALAGSRAELRGVVGSDSVTCEPSGELARKLLDGLLARASSAVSPFGRLRQAIAAVSREALASTQGRASYRSDVYYVRPRLLRQVDDFSASDQVLALLTGPSGMGKTALGCYLVDRWLVSTDETHAVLLLFAHELTSAEKSLARWLRNRLGHAWGDLMSAAGQSGARVLVIIDGLERAADPLGLLDEVVQLGQAGSAGKVHFLVTLTESVLTSLLKSLRSSAPGLSPHLIVIPPLSATEGRQLYRVFQGPRDESPALLPADLFQTLATPLLIRLAHASSLGGTTLTIGQILLAYTEQVVFSDLARTEIVHQLVDRIMESGARTVPTAELAQDTWMRAAMLSEGPESPIKSLVRDGILFLEWIPSDSPLPLPSEAHIGFTFDQLLDFVVFARMVRRFGGDTESLVRLAERATASSPLVGGLRFFVLERLRGSLRPSLPMPPGFPKLMGLAFCLSSFETSSSGLPVVRAATIRCAATGWDSTGARSATPSIPRIARG
jgi:hypothetical protein